MSREKRTRREKSEKFGKTTVKKAESSEGLKAVFMFDMIDIGGAFAFDVNRLDFEHKEFLEKLIAYTNMTWGEIRKQTHDKSNKSKHHFLTDIEKFSKAAQERVKIILSPEDTDRIYSFAFNNKLRIVGLRDHEKFHVLWYDPEHKIYPSSK